MFITTWRAGKPRLKEAEMKVVLSTGVIPNEQELDVTQASAMKACQLLSLLGPDCPRASW
jgi:hypothetical protein